jgi:hypothetical protein
MEVITLLVDRDASLDVVDDNQQNCLHDAAFNDRLDLCLYLIDVKGFDPAVLTSSGGSAISHYGCFVGDEQTIAEGDERPALTPAVEQARVAMLVAAPPAPKKEAPRKEAVKPETKAPSKPEAKPSAEVKAAPRTGDTPKSGVRGADAFGRTQTRYDNGVTAVTTPDPFGGSSTRYSNGVTATTRTDPFGGTTTRYSNGVTATTRPDPFGGTTTTFSDGTRATTRPDPFGNQITTYSDGRRETIRPDPFAKKETANERK